MSLSDIPAVPRPAPPVERKVKAAGAGAAAGAVVAEAVNWALDRYLFTPDMTGDLPGPVSALVLLACSAGAAFAAGWWARHTPRPDLPPAQR